MLLTDHLLPGRLLLQAATMHDMYLLLLPRRLLFKADAVLLPMDLWALSRQLLLQAVSAILLATNAGAL